VRVALTCCCDFMCMSGDHFVHRPVSDDAKRQRCESYTYGCPPSTSSSRRRRILSPRIEALCVV
jgi:hypothetical protein